jgi:hypothetical protein
LGVVRPAAERYARHPYYKRRVDRLEKHKHKQNCAQPDQNENLHKCVDAELIF